LSKNQSTTIDYARFIIWSATDIPAHGMTAGMNVAPLSPFPASNKKIPGFLRLELAGFLSVRRFKAVFVLR
jgi:hypothetical protein